MTPEFHYHRKDGRDKLEIFGLSLLDMAVELAYIARRMYNTIMKKNPEQAEAFRQAAIQAFTHPVTWDATKAPPVDTEIMLCIPKKEEQ